MSSLTEKQKSSAIFFKYLAGGQSAYFSITGIWPLLSIRTFEMITGPKTDKWLVKTAGVLITTIGAVLGLAARRGEATPEIALLAVGSAAGLAGIDVVYVAKKRISPIYLLDAVGEIVLIALWVALWRMKDGKFDKGEE